MRNTILGGLFVVTITFFYPQKAGKSQVVKKADKSPVVKVVLNPNDRIADERQSEIIKTRAIAEQAQQDIIKSLKKEIAQKSVVQKEAKVKIVYRTVYKKTIDTVFIHVPAGEVYSPLDSNDYNSIPHECKKDTIYIYKKGWLQKIFSKEN